MMLRQSDLMLMLAVLSLDFLAAGHSTAYATQFTVTPAQGQTAQQVGSDQAACASTAQQSSGHNPSQTVATAALQPQVGGRVKGAATGAAAGAVGAQVRGNQYQAYNNLSDDAQQQYRQNQAKSAAAAGAVVGGMISVRTAGRHADKTPRLSSNRRVPLAPTIKPTRAACKTAATP